jgi:hypothetical protein
MSDMYLYFANGLPFVYLLVGQVAASSKLRAKGHQATNLFGSWILPVQLPFSWAHHPMLWFST